MSQSTTISVTVEALPHNENLDGVILNRPAPSGGSFMIDQHVPRDAWNQMKAAGATYWSAEELEEMDMFFTAPGWRYTLDALHVLIRHGYTLEIFDASATTADELNAMFTAEAIAAYNQRQQEQREAEAQAAEAKRRQEEAEDERKRVEYETWKQQHLTGLIKTFANDAHDPTVEIDWQRVAHFDGPDAWYGTGDSWYEATIDGHKCYKCYYGNAIKSYAPQHIVDRWIEAHWQWMVNTVYSGNQTAAARSVLVDSLQDYIGSDIAKRLVEIHGAAHFVNMATSSEWWIFGRDTLGWTTNSAAHYGASCTKLTEIRVGTEVFTSAAKFQLPTGKPVRSYWRHPDGRIIACGYSESEFAVVAVDDLPEIIRHYFA